MIAVIVTAPNQNAQSPDNPGGLTVRVGDAVQKLCGAGAIMASCEWSQAAAVILLPSSLPSPGALFTGAQKSAGDTCEGASEDPAPVHRE